MAKICPFTNDVVLYLTCKECEDAEECRILHLKKNKEKKKREGKLHEKSN